MNLLKSLAAVSSMTMISRVLGFVRDTIVARMFGAGMATDAFFVAFKLPNLLRRIFAEGAFSQAFVPILAEYKTQQGEEAARTFIAYVSGLLTLVLALVTALGILAAPWVIWITAPGFADTPEKFDLTTALLRVTFPYILLISLASLAGAILNTWNRFSVPAFVPTLLNVSMIAFSLFLTPYFDPPVMALGWAVLAGGLAQLLYQLPHLKKIGMLVLPRLNLRDSGVWRVLKQMGPAILGVSVSQISLIINTIFASFLAAGSVSWMYYADRLMELPSGVLGVALGTILLPSLAKTYASDDRHEYSRLMDWGLRLCFLLVLPCALALALIAEPLTVSLFQYGKFSANDALMTQRALIAYAVGLLGIILVKVLAPGFYARQNIRTPVKIALFTLISTQAMNLVFIGPLKHAGLALAISLAACLNAGLLYWQLRKHDLFEPQPGWAKFLGKLVLAVLVMSAVLLGLMHFMPAWDLGGMPLRLARLGVLVVAGVVAYFGMLALLGFRLRDFSRRAVS
ncbi:MULTISPECIES: murein biosynthesis integral membrane protein MurJ [unclassified Pseudomonas]|uniref:murein biosynthesis integral membrane protein MurJ n=1 Tax=unclassified Pseudomonas TaxID=196821 RepID=UPI0002A3F84D|nr:MULTISPECIES: murein biosynthesis integral membrane protein MurJ [unclassified Pseudomonas]MBB1605919.1 murein biosynthesis integral membrane protein MurJ [Pseudomonas sp. UMC76]MBB1639034.1 murein biosynthesis integral membrane protein MurJ [Pseudomonas sp. UME83]NTX90178.1 murein biosynthesis integral membrane protein MurJ [Pseudomonas sp. UMA643]NTY20688.1 murein biosynthesis integral membrane protein MurJ [Pseudomonas sp. UMC3103]NTY26026.1 murein biosynthesis integral membrane protein 